MPWRMAPLLGWTSASHYLCSLIFLQLLILSCGFSSIIQHFKSIRFNFHFQFTFAYQIFSENQYKFIIFLTFAFANVRKECMMYFLTVYVTIMVNNCAGDRKCEKRTKKSNGEFLLPFKMEVRKPKLRIRISEFGSQLWLLILVSYYCTDQEAAVMVLVIRPCRMYLAYFLGSCLMPSTLLNPSHQEHLGNEVVNGSCSCISLFCYLSVNKQIKSLNFKILA